MAEYVIRLENASRIYGRGKSQVVAVNNISAEVESAKLTMLMGPSGSGKTTLLMLMGCLLKPSAGNVYVFGTKVSEMTEKELPFLRRRYFGFVFQSFNLFPALTALENVEATLTVKHIRGSKARREACDLLESVGLKDRMRQLPENLSGGEKQRVAIARALAGDPPVVLADEPTGQLDSRSGRFIVEMLKGIALARKCAVFMVTHDNRITDAADRILRMEDGVLAQEPAARE